MYINWSDEHGLGSVAAQCLCFSNRNKNKFPFHCFKNPKNKVA